MKENNKKTDATMYKQSEVDELFALVKTEKGIIICVGKFKVSNKTFKSFKEADRYIETKPYEILINVTVLMTNLHNYENNKETATNTESN